MKIHKNKKLVSFFTFFLLISMIVSGSFMKLKAEAITVNNVSTDNIIVHFKSPGGAANIYYWSTVPETATVTWPGVAMTSEGEGWYGYTLKDAQSSNMIFNYNGSQTIDLSRTSGEWWYDKTWTNVDPRGDTTAPVVTAVATEGNEGKTITLGIKDNKDASPKLYYTTDGSEPKITSALYTGTGIFISKTTTIATLAVDNSGNMGVQYFRYVIGVDDKSDFRDDTIYFVMTTRFNDGDTSNNVHAFDDVKAGNPDSDPAWRGDFKGLTEKLDYIKALGFSAIWITPPVKNVSGYDYHGYHAINFQEVDPRYKTKDDISAEESYKKFIDAAHSKGMKVIQDIVLNHTGNFGEENLYPLFQRNTVEPTLNETYSDVIKNIAPEGKIPVNYSVLTPAEQFQARIRALRAPIDSDAIYHNHEFKGGWEQYEVQIGSIAGDCQDLNTENPTVSKYLVDSYKKYIDMGVDSFRLDTVKHISRLTLNNDIVPQLKAAGGEDFYMFGEVCTRWSGVWNSDIPAISAPFYTWKESKLYPWGDRLTNEASAQQNYIDNQGGTTGSQPTSDNTFLKGNAYHAPDYSKKSGLDVIDFPMHWAFRDARNAFGLAVGGDKWYNDATWNVTYVDSHDYAPDQAPENQRFAGTQDTWAENLNLMFSFRGIPCIYYGSEIEFQKGKPIDVGPNAKLSDTGRAYFGDKIKGTVDVTDFGKYTNATGTMAESLNYPLAKHITRLNLIRRAVPALRKGEYSVEGINGDGMAFKRRFTDASEGVDSFCLVTLSGNATFSAIPNGKYTDAVTGTVKNVTNGTLTAECSGKGNMRVYVLDLPGNSAPGKIGEAGVYLK